MPANKTPASKVAKTTPTPKENKKRHKKRIESFGVYIYKVLK